jgi:RNA-directed DNA polymerase
MTRTHASNPWCRYADDGLVHCVSESQALALKVSLQNRFAECGLEMHPDKTQVVYCKDDRRKGEYPRMQFDFLGYSFRPRVVRLNQPTRVFVSFNPAVSKASSKAMRAYVPRSGIRNRSNLSLGDIAQDLCGGTPAVPALPGTVRDHPEARLVPSSAQAAHLRDRQH